MGKSKSDISGSGGYFDKLFSGSYGDLSYNDMVAKFLYDVSSSAQGSNIGANQLAYLESLQQQSYETSEREASQQWEEDFYNKYSSPSAMVRQYQEAGLNPALMYGNAGASTGDIANSSPANGAQAEPVSPVSQLDILRGIMSSFNDIVQDAYSINQTVHQGQVNRRYNEQVNQELSLKKAQEVETYAKANFETEQAETEGVMRTYYKAKTAESKHQVFLIDSQIQKIFSDIEVNDAYMEVLHSEVGLNEERIKVARAEWEKLDEETKKLRTESAYGYFFAENKEILKAVALLNNNQAERISQEIDVEAFKQGFREATGFEFGSDIGQVLATCAFQQFFDAGHLGIKDYGVDWKKLAKMAGKYSRKRNYDPKGTAAVAGSFMLGGTLVRSFLGGAPSASNPIGTSGNPWAGVM